MEYIYSQNVGLKGNLNVIKTDRLPDCPANGQFLLDFPDEITFGYSCQAKILGFLKIPLTKFI